MKILLVKPYNKSDHIQPSLGLGYLATAVREGNEVTILDCIKERMGPEKLAEYVKKHRPDLVGLQCYTFDLDFIRVSLSMIKRDMPEIITVVGGPHPSAMPEKMFSAFKGHLDFLFVGEAERGFRMLVEDLAGGEKGHKDIPGLVWRDGPRVVVNERIFTDDLDKLGMPAWDLIKPEEYPESQHGAFFKQFPIAPIMVTRGCPYPCAFCAGGVVAGKKVRRRSVGNVIAEILMLNKDRGIKEFHIVDDNFTSDREYAKALLRRLKDLELGMTWAVPNGVRMETLDRELVELMKETGLYMVSLGIESGSDHVLRLMKKGTTVSRIRECVQLIRGCGMDVSGFFILGYPGETMETIKQTIDLSTSLGLSRANYFTYLPFPGSDSYRELEERGELDTVNWERLYFMNAPYVPKGLSRKGLKKMHRLAFARFYLRPGIIIYHIRSIKSLRHFYFLLRRFFNWIVFS